MDFGLRHNPVQISVVTRCGLRFFICKRGGEDVVE